MDQCIRSIESQLYGDYEHIIVDAFSTDRTPAIIENYAAADNRVRVMQSDPRGISNAMNLGILNARGSVIQHLHSDDYYHSDQTLSVVHDAFITHPRKSMVIGLCSRNRNGSIQSGLLSSSTFKRRKLLLRYLIYVHCYIAHPATFINKSVFDRHGLFDESFKIAMDYEFWLRVLGKESFLMMNRELTVFRHHKESASFDLEERILEEERARKLHSYKLRAIIARTIFSRAVELREQYNQKKI